MHSKHIIHFDLKPHNFLICKVPEAWTMPAPGFTGGYSHGGTPPSSAIFPPGAGGGPGGFGSRPPNESSSSHLVPVVAQHASFAVDGRPPAMGVVSEVSEGAEEGLTGRGENVSALSSSGARVLDPWVARTLGPEELSALGPERALGGEAASSSRGGQSGYTTGIHGPPHQFGPVPSQLPTHLQSTATASSSVGGTLHPTQSGFTGSASMSSSYQPLLTTLQRQQTQTFLSGKDFRVYCGYCGYCTDCRGKNTRSSVLTRGHVSDVCDSRVCGLVQLCV